jgi:hypothetical protein
MTSNTDTHPQTLAAGERAWTLLCIWQRSIYRTKSFEIARTEVRAARSQHRPEEEEEEEEELFVFNDTIEGPRAPAVKPGRVTQA